MTDTPSGQKGVMKPRIGTGPISGESLVTPGTVVKPVIGSPRSISSFRILAGRAFVSMSRDDWAPGPCP
jgi:hypothetical protein